MNLKSFKRKAISTMNFLPREKPPRQPPKFSWDSVENDLDMGLPVDYKSLVDDKGCFDLGDDFITIAHPLSKTFNLLKEFAWTQNLYDWYDNEGLLDEWPAQAKVGPGSLMPWGRILEFRGYWVVTDEPPEEWEILIGTDGFDWTRFRGSLTDFLSATLSGFRGDAGRKIEIVSDGLDIIEDIKEEFGAGPLAPLLTFHSDYFISLEEVRQNASVRGVLK